MTAPGFQKALAQALGVSLLAGILVAWTPRYWGVTVALVSMAVAGVAWALTARQVELPPQTILVAAIGAWGFLQLALHHTRVPWPTTLRSMEWAMGAVSFVLGSQILRGSRSRKAFLDLMLWAVTALAVVAMLQMYATPGRLFGIIPVADNVIGTLYYKNQYAAMMELAAPIALWKIYNRQVLSGGLCFAAMFAATVTSASRTGFILLSVEFFVALILMVGARRMPIKSAASILLIVASLVTAASMVGGTERLFDYFRQENPYALRGALLASTLKMIPLHPGLGSGIGTWPWEYPGFATYDDGTYVNEAHNDWVQWASEGGLPFMLLLATLTLWLAKPAVQSVWGLGVLSLMIHSSVDYPLREPVLGFLWFTLAGALTSETEGIQMRKPDFAPTQ